MQYRFDIFLDPDFVDFKGFSGPGTRNIIGKSYFSRFPDPESPKFIEIGQKNMKFNVFSNKN